MRARRALSLTLGGAAVLGLLLLAARDVVTILRLSREEEALRLRSGDAAVLSEADGAPALRGDADLVWVSGAHSPSQPRGHAEGWTAAPKPLGAALAAVGSTAPPTVGSKNSILGHDFQRPPTVSTKLSEAELQQLAAAAKLFDKPHAPGSSHPPELERQVVHVQEAAHQPDLALELEKLRERLEPNPGAHRGALVPTPAASRSNDPPAASAECPPDTENGDKQSPSGTASSFSCDWESLGTPTVVLDPSAPLTFAFLK